MSKKKKETTMSFRGKEIDLEINEEKKIEKAENKEKKSKLNIFLLIISLLVVIGYGYYLYQSTDFSNLETIDIIKSVSFVLLALILILMFFKINNKYTTPYIIFFTLILIGYSFFNISYAKEDFVYVSDFINKDYSEVLDWANNYNIEINTLYEYSDTVEINHVIMQEYGVTTLASEINSLTITLSLGPNPDKEIIVPNFIGFTFDEVMKYIKENHLNNVNIEFVISDNTRDTVIEQKGSGSMKRSDLIELTFSHGNEIEPVKVKDLKGLSLFEATSFLKRYGIEFEISYEFSDDIASGYIISQDKIDEIVKEIKIIVSKGKKITVPNLAKMTAVEIAKWASLNNIKISYEEVYNKEYDYGKIISFSALEGEIIEEGAKITITLSKGSLTMPNVNSVSDFKIWANTNNITYEEVYEFSTTIKSGEIIKLNPDSGQKITENDTVIITISKGKSVTIPNFVGLSKNEANNKCKNAGLSCSFTYGSYTESTNRDIVISQSKKSGLTVAEGININITLSSGIIEKVNVPKLIGKTKSEITSTCNSLGVTCNFTYNNTYSNEAKDIAISQDKSGNMAKGSTINFTLSIGSAKSYTVVIDGSLLSLGNPEQTKNTLKSKLEASCPGVNFNFTFKSVNSGIGYLNPSSDVKVGSNTFVQGKTYNVIINSN